MQVVFENLHRIKYPNGNQTTKLYLNLHVIQNKYTTYNIMSYTYST